MINRRSLLAAGSACFLARAADAMRVGPMSAADPGKFFNDWDPANRAVLFNSGIAKTPRSVTLNGGENTLVMICAGQSLSTNNIADTFTPTNGSKLDNYSWFDGKNYVAANPLIGTGGASHNFNFKVADGLISNGKFSRVIIVPVAVGGVTIGWYANEGQSATAPTGYYQAINAAAKKLAAQGITTATPDVKFLVKWNQGESDTQQSTSQADYTAEFNKMFNKVSADIPGAKWSVAKETHYIGNVSSAVQAAQLALVDNVTIFAGENMDSITDANRNPDQTHLTAAGANLAVTMGIAAITAISF